MVELRPEDVDPRLTTFEFGGWSPEHDPLPGWVREARHEKRMFARELRRNPTPAEAALYPHLRRLRRPGMRVRRQFTIRGYIADFAFPSRKLLVEVDGSVHRDQAAYDRKRDADLRRAGYRTLRFTNEEVLADPARVAAAVAQALAV